MSNLPQTNQYLLNSKNYATWATMMRAELYSNGCLAVVKRESVQNAEVKNLELYSIIVKHLGEEHISIVNSELGEAKEGNGLALWELLKRKYAGNKAHHRMMALGSFIDIKSKEMKAFLTEIRESISKIRTAGLKIDKQIISLLLLKKLLKDYESLIRIITQCN